MPRVMLPLLLAAAACTGAEPPGRQAADPPAEPPAEGAPGSREARFRALGASFVGSGNEPGWLLAMWPDSVILVADYGTDTLRFPAVEPEVLGTGRRLWALEAGGRSLSLAISAEPCQDDMSGAGYPATIQYVLDSLTTRRGCGTPLGE
jgi:putative lipoprotein